MFGLLLFCATIVFLRDYRVLERYRYTIAAASIGLLLLPRVPGIGVNSNGAYLAINFGSLQFQPAEFAKIGDRHLPGELPARDARRARPRPPAADQPQALRSAAPGLGRARC